MTKQEFLTGREFKIETGNYKFIPGKDAIHRVYRTSDGNRVLFEDHQCNIDKIGTKDFTAYTFVLGKYIKIKHRFEDLPLHEYGGVDDVLE